MRPTCIGQYFTHKIDDCIAASTEELYHFELISRIVNALIRCLFTALDSTYQFAIMEETWTNPVAYFKQFDGRLSV